MNGNIQVDISTNKEYIVNSSSVNVVLEIGFLCMLEHGNERLHSLLDVIQDSNIGQFYKRKRFYIEMKCERKITRRL